VRWSTSRIYTVYANLFFKVLCFELRAQSAQLVESRLTTHTANAPKCAGAMLVLAIEAFLPVVIQESGERRMNEWMRRE
jgi:hypothetical protein